jgi:hypothetical protein
MRSARILPSLASSHRSDAMAQLLDVVADANDKRLPEIDAQLDVAFEPEAVRVFVNGHKRLPRLHCPSRRIAVSTVKLNRSA